MVEPLPIADPGVSGTGRVAARLTGLLKATLAALELTPAQYRILITLSEGPSGATRLARLLVVRPPSLTGVVDGLVARGLVERANDPDDRRRVAHRLTPEGTAALAAADQAVEARLADVLTHVAPRQAAKASAGLGVWAQALDAYSTTRLERR